MNFITINKFLNLFNRESSTFEYFYKEAHVKTSNNLVPLNEYVSRNKINKEDIKIIFENIEHKEKYLKNFYNKSLLPKMDSIGNKPLSFPKPMKKNEINNNSLVQYKNIIRNIHYQNILMNTKTDIENIPTFLHVLKDFYIDYVIDYKLLCKSSLFYIKKGRIGSVFSSYFFRASIMNPYIVYSLNESVLSCIINLMPCLIGL